MILVTGGAGFIGANFVLDWIAATGEPVVNLDKLTYAGNLGNLAPVRDDARHMFVRGDIGDRGAVAKLLASTGRARWSTSPPRPTSTARSTARTRSSRPTSSAPSSCSRRSARTGPRCRRTSATPSASCTCRPTRSTARSGPTTRRSPRRRPTRRTALLGVEGRVRSPGARLAPHLRPAGAHDQLLEQLRPVPVPREADPADDPQRARRQAAAGVRRRPEGARLALRRRPLRRDPRGARARPAGRDLQRRRPHRDEEPRRRAHALRGARARASAAATTRRSSPSSPTVPATTAATRSTRARSRASSAGARPRPSRAGCAKTVRWYLDNEAWLKAVQTREYQSWISLQYEPAA